MAKLTKKLVAVDLFAGAGGFSEGFRQVGIDVRVAYENWAPARLTHEKNHPKTKAILLDVLTLTVDRIKEDAGVDHVDILFGSPPCTEFSMSKNGGDGDIDKGLMCVFAFLRLVHQLKPTYWVMENVPRLGKFLDKLRVDGGILLRTIGIDDDGILPLPNKVELNAVDCGVPQRRTRLFIGDFPEPQMPITMIRHCKGAKSLRDILSALPDPEGEIPLDQMITDPIYENLVIDAAVLTDHFNQHLRLGASQIARLNRIKRDHSFYGQMTFPDNQDTTVRTIVSRHHPVAREGIYVRTYDGGIRRLSPRETASLMGFPITYQFYGLSDRIRFGQIGNAVCPPVAALIGRADSLSHE